MSPQYFLDVRVREVLPGGDGQLNLSDEVWQYARLVHLDTSEVVDFYLADAAYAIKKEFVDG